MTLEEYRAELDREYEEDWCHCEGDTSTEYWADGEHPTCYKHCWTCRACGKLVQVG
ncbi:MAG: hypothetical protein GTO63_16565 [Anaerolineae bacterium]|nr:hypothetical protein [Anaerolineae bacterium]NIN96424.1 hypothetical protein [Anaerolineae bacterium]NIQ79460.1 hypothetical protein [Anaerolineae bacterium]